MLKKATLALVVLILTSCSSVLLTGRKQLNLVSDEQVLAMSDSAYHSFMATSVVFEGILPVTQTDAGLAVVLGHEIAHAIAKYANERMSQQLAANSVGSAVATIFQYKSQTAQTVANTGYALFAEYGFALPFSRKQEYEADRLGLIFMAMAGYDPQESIHPLKNEVARLDNLVFLLPTA